MDARGTASEARLLIAARGSAFISEATGFDNGFVFESEEQVRAYFSVQELEDVFGEPCPWTQEALDVMADAVIEHRWHMVQ